MDKYTKKAQKAHEKAIKKTLKRARVPKNATKEQIEAYLIHYVKNDKLDYYSLRFTDEQLANPNFLLSLYRANNKLTNFIIPNPNNEELQNNIDFMIEYIKLRHQWDMENSFSKESYWAATRLRWAIQDYTKAISNPEFIQKLVETFPNLPIIPIIQESLVKNTVYTISSKEAEQDWNNYKECLSKLPIELLYEQVKQHGHNILNLIPKDIPNYTQLVSAGVEADGFKALNKVDISQVLQNKHLVMKAYEKDGSQGLTEYLQSLTPYRTQHYMCHGELHDYQTFDERYIKLKLELMADAQIQEILKQDPTQEQKSIPNPSSSEEDNLNQ